MAEGEQVQWLDGQANVEDNAEKICPMRRIRQNQWQSEWNEMYLGRWSYDYISDYECIFNHPIDEKVKDLYIDCDNLQAAKQQGTKVPITNLAHFTKSDVADTIIESGGFIGGMKKINEDAQGNDIKAKFSWWSPKFSEGDIKQVRNTLGGVIQPFLDEQDNLDQLKNQFATSDAFVPNPQRYGTSYFQYDINYLCQQYENQVGGEVQFKILGTFGYKQEVMHAVLVCSQANGDGMFGAYPDVLTPEEDVNNEAVVTRDNDGNWIWKPQATGAVIKRLYNHWQRFPKYRRWEHVAFAFHFPDEWGMNQEAIEAIMFVPELTDHQP
ncbi:uncharacterized protein LOC144664097 [Oculina patagonica]